jgi:hypothetical protein
MRKEIVSELKKFTYNGYVKLLGSLKDKYNIVPFCEIPKDNAYLVLRHDVDASLESALKMATMENSLEIKATYFVLFSHKLYNLLNKQDLAILRKISGLGHEIGLHYDSTVYESYNRNLELTLENEISLLERILHRKILSISCHNPSIIKRKDPLKIAKHYINAYDPEIFDLYVSDSCRAWCLKDLYQLLNFSYNKVQLLIHPFLWTEDTCGRDVILERLFDKVEEKNRLYKMRWLNIWRNSPKVKKYEDSLGN